MSFFSRQCLSMFFIKRKRNKSTMCKLIRRSDMFSINSNCWMMDWRCDAFVVSIGIWKYGIPSVSWYFIFSYLFAGEVEWFSIKYHYTQNRRKRKKDVYVRVWMGRMGITYIYISILARNMFAYGLSNGYLYIPVPLFSEYVISFHRSNPAHVNR